MDSIDIATVKSARAVMRRESRHVATNPRGDRDLHSAKQALLHTVLTALRHGEHRRDVAAAAGWSPKQLDEELRRAGENGNVLAGWHHRHGA
jgi:hypothetical protein